MVITSTWFSTINPILMKVASLLRRYMLPFFLIDHSPWIFEIFCYKSSNPGHLWMDSLDYVCAHSHWLEIFYRSSDKDHFMATSSVLCPELALLECTNCCLTKGCLCFSLPNGCALVLYSAGIKTTSVFSWESPRWNTASQFLLQFLWYVRSDRLHELSLLWRKVPSSVS